jgi:choline kinase
MKDFVSNVVILAAGRGQRFARAGFQEEKILTELNGKPVLYYNLMAILDLGIEVTVVASPRVSSWLRQSQQEGVHVVEVPQVQPSPVHSALLAGGYMKESEQVMILDGDQVYQPSTLPSILGRLTDGFGSKVIVTPNGPNPSYCSVHNVHGRGGVYLREKDGQSVTVVSGGYGFSSWEAFRLSAFQVLSRNIQGEARMSDVVNDSGPIWVQEIPEDYWVSVGTPEELVHARSVIKRSVIK